MTVFTGLCIGGPQDGTLFSGTLSRMLCRELTSEFTIEPYALDQIVRYIDHYYTWTPVVHGYTGLWVSEDLSMEQAIQKLIEGYKPNEI